MRKCIVIVEDDVSSLKYADYLREIYPGTSFYICRDLTDAEYRVLEEPGLEKIDRLLVDMNIGDAVQRIPDKRGGWKWLQEVMKEHQDYPRDRIALVTMYVDKLDDADNALIQKEGIRVFDKIDDEIISQLESFCS